MAVKARLTKWQQREKSRREQLSTADLKRRIRESGYFKLRADQSITEAQTVQRFLAQLEADDPRFL